VPNKTPAIISTILTLLILVIFAVLSVFTQMIALNSVSERQGVTAISISLVCQGVGVLLAGIFAWWMTNLMIAKFNWKKILAVIIAVTIGTLAGGLISFLSIVIAIPVAGIR